LTLCAVAPQTAALGAESANGSAAREASAAIPLPEHPRPDFMRAGWQNLNGVWRFQFDKGDAGQREGWPDKGLPSPRSIVVPFPWGSRLSGIEDEGDVGWYERTVAVSPAWRGKRVFLVIGASDWRTTAWLDGREVGQHQGGYTPFSFELTSSLRAGEEQRLVIRVDDTAHPFKLEGKQGYGRARGLWQTPYLEVRGGAPLRSIHYTPRIGQAKVAVTARLLEPAREPLTLKLDFKTGGVPSRTKSWPKGAESVSFEVPMPGARLWSLEDPFLYEVTARVSGAGVEEDVVETYFGMREVSVIPMPGTNHPYVALNGRPVYLQLALDQAYHPDGFYTFPSDEVLRDEILRARQIGLNGVREHVKIETPRKLYWADRLGVLVMADVPNAWGEPDAPMRQEIEYSLRAMIERDFNHPSIFAWVPFNETWGLFTTKDGKKEYLADTQRWVASVFRMAKGLDPTRLVEDNSVCCGRGHTETDINSWHEYSPGWAWDEHLDSISAKTYPGSTWNFEQGYSQGGQPNINSEFGNVWGYEGSTGDVDWSWDYHRAINSFRRHPKIAGWLYTEHHDVINEWNGYWRFDRSNKETGLSELVEGMTLRDLHSPLYVVVGTSADLSRTVRCGETVEVPLWASFLTDTRAHGESLRLEAELYGWNVIGQKKTYGALDRSIPYRPWMSEAIAPLSVAMPTEPAVAILAVRLEDGGGNVLHRNFTSFVVECETPSEVSLDGGKRARIVRIEPSRYSDAKWSLKTWNVLDGLKVNGAGSGHFEYRIPWPKDLNAASVESVTFLVEASAKALYAKDRDDVGKVEGDFMLGKGTSDPSLNPNSYPMTDETPFESAVSVRVNGEIAGRYELADDPADHRGILSWNAQLRDRRLREAGSYGQLLRVPLPRHAIEKASSSGTLTLRLEVDEALPHGLALYGAKFGRYPLDPSIVFTLRD
jgi:hypothetical protein